MVSAAILAGGHARRLGGVDKGALVVGGRTILDRLLAALHEVSDDVMIVGRVRPAGLASGAPVRAVVDRQPGLGPLGGLDAALAAATHDLVVVTACDMPFVSARLLRVLLEQAAGVDRRAPIAIVPQSDRGYHPLCAVYARACAPVVQQQLARGQLRMMDLLGALEVRTVARPALEAAGDPGTLLANVNTPGEHDAVERLLGHEL